MIINAGKTVDFSIVINDKNGIAVYDDTPSAVVKSLTKNKFFNGLFFMDEETEIILPHVGGGKYSFSMFMESVDELEVLIKSDKYSKSEAYHVIVIPEKCERFCKPGEEFTFFMNKSKALNMLTYMITNKDGLYYALDVDKWVELKTVNLFTPVSDSMYKMSLILNEGVYSVTVMENLEPVITYTINCTTESPKDEVIMISSKTLTASDGTASNVINEQGGPIKGVKVSAIDVITKKPVAMTTTNESGDWHFMITRGKYLFTFERQGYTATTLLKEV